MNRKYLKLIAFLFSICLVVFICISRLDVYSLVCQTKNKSYVEPIISGHEDQVLPNIDILLVDSLTHINLAAQAGKKAVVLFYFSPYCPFCRSELDEILKNIKSLKDIQFYLISPFLLSEIKVFSEENKLDQHANIAIGRDFEFKFAEYFRAEVVPYLAVYSKSGKLNGAFIGGVKFDQILSVSKE